MRIDLKPDAPASPAGTIATRAGWRFDPDLGVLLSTRPRDGYTALLGRGGAELGLYVKAEMFDRYREGFDLRGWKLAS